MIITRKISLSPSGTDEEKKEAYTLLWDYSNISYRAANIVSSHYFIQEQVKNLIYFTEDVKVKLMDIAKDDKGILVTSLQNSGYRILSHMFKGQIPTSILACINSMVYKNFRSERNEYFLGERSLRSYKKGMPFPFSAKEVKNLTWLEEKNRFTFSLFGCSFDMFLGKDRSNNRIVIDRVLAGDYKLCDSSIKIFKDENKKTRIYFYFTVDIKEREVVLDKNKVGYAVLGIDQPIQLRIGKKVFDIGLKEEFLHRRLQIQGARHRLQKSSKYTEGGKGRKGKLKALDRFTNLERNYIDTKCHTYSRLLVDLCIKHQIGKLVLIDQKVKEKEAQMDEFLLRNWSYGNLKNKIDYKSNLFGLDVVLE